MKKVISLLIATFMVLLTMNGVYALTQLEDDYVVYHINEDCVKSDGTIHIDGNKISQALLEKAWSKKPGENWVPGETSVGKLKFINDLPYDIEIKDYTVKVPSYENVEPIGPSQTLRTELPYTGSTGTGATGKDGNVIPIGLNCFRCPNEAVTALYGKRATQITLEDLMHLENKLEEVYGQKMTYAQYLCLYYKVNSLDELTARQKSKILDGGNFYVTLLGNPSILQEEATLTYACSENNGRLYIVHEFDKDVIELGYNYYFDSLMTFSFDNSLQQLNDKTSFDYAVMNYLDDSSVARQQLDQFLIGKTIKKGETITFDSLQYHISGPLMGNAYANREVPSFLDFDFQFEPLAIQGYAFKDNNGNGYLDDNDERLSHIKMNLWQGNDLVETTQTDENGYYQFNNKREGDTYRLTTELLDGYTLTKNSTHTYGNTFTMNDEGKPQYGEFKVTDRVVYYNVGYIEKTYQVNYDANGGEGEQVDEKNPYHYQDQVTVLDQGQIHRDGYTFEGWNTKADGSGDSYSAAQVFEMPQHNVTFYAMWKKVPDETPTPEEPKTPENPSTTITVKKTPTQSQTKTEKVNTSDQAQILVTVLVLLGSLAGAIVMKSLKKKQ